MEKALRVIIGLGLVFQLTACSTVEKNSNTPEGSFAIAEDFDKGERYEEPIRRYNDVKNKFPYSSYATKAELAIADVYYKQESFAESQVAYHSFRDLHPKHPQIDYVVFRIGISYFNQLPSTIDRDLSLAHDAVSSFNDLIKNYPQSQYTKEAQDKRTESLKMLAQKEEYIADFYFKQEVYDSALTRYENLYVKYADLGFEAKALSRASICAVKVNDTKKLKKYSELLFQKFNDSSEASAVRKEIH